MLTLASCQNCHMLFLHEPVILFFFNPGENWTISYSVTWIHETIGFMKRDFAVLNSWQE